MDAKRGQVTIFIIIGFVLIVAFGLLFYSASELSRNKMESGQQALSSSEITSVRTYAQSCIEQTLTDSIIHVGITNYTLLGYYFNTHLKDCTHGFQGSPEISVSEGIVSSDFFPTDDNKQIIGNIRFPLVVSKGRSNSSMTDFQISYDLNSQASLQLQDGIALEESEIASKDGKAKAVIPKYTNITRKDGTAVGNISVLIRKSEKNNLTQVEYDFQPEGLVFDPPITLEFGFNDEDNDGIVDGTAIKDDELVITYKAYPYLFVNLPTEIDMANKKITSQISHFSTYKISSRKRSGVGIANVYLIDPITTPDTIKVELTGLDGSGYLRGTYADILNIKYESEYPTPRVWKQDLNFSYNPALYGSQNYWGYDDVTDEGHRFDEASTYFYFDSAARYYHNRFGFVPRKAVKVGMYDTASDLGHYNGDYSIAETLPTSADINSYRDIRGQVHEYTHLVQGEWRDSTDLPYDTDDEKALVECFAKYFEYAFTNTSVDPYIFNPADGVKDVSEYGKWTYQRNSGRLLVWVIASTWWQLRQDLGDDKTDRLVFKAMTIAKYEGCAGPDALRATLKADDILNLGSNKLKIIHVFNQHNIFTDKCYVGTS